MIDKLIRWDIERAIQIWRTRDHMDVQQIEHGLDLGGLLHHEYWICIPPLTVQTRLVVWHPENCGCDAIPDEVVLHG